ncbi:MAG: SlyX family protein [Verrucomicrobia bacterium]|nr:SlyX family protein [Verrucomicrobiota bacterium]
MEADKRAKFETDLAFLDKTVSELSKVVFEQQKQIDALTRSNRLLVDKLAGISESNDTSLPEHEKPPHY